MIIIPVHNSFGGFFNRDLIYTAISRARDICITVGQWGALDQAARQDRERQEDYMLGRADQEGVRR